MKKETHPTYFANATATCACGASFVVGSTLEKIDVEICSACHPFYTGTDKILDTAGRVERFKSRRASAQPARKKKEIKAEKRTARKLKNAAPQKKTVTKKKQDRT